MGAEWKRKISLYFALREVVFFTVTRCDVDCAFFLDRYNNSYSLFLKCVHTVFSFANIHTNNQELNNSLGTVLLH